MKQMNAWEAEKKLPVGWIWDVNFELADLVATERIPKHFQQRLWGKLEGSLGVSCFLDNWLWVLLVSFKSIGLMHMTHMSAGMSKVWRHLMFANCFCMGIFATKEKTCGTNLPPKENRFPWIRKSILKLHFLISTFWCWEWWCVTWLLMMCEKTMTGVFVEAFEDQTLLDFFQSIMSQSEEMIYWDFECTNFFVHVSINVYAIGASKPNTSDAQTTFFLNGCAGERREGYFLHLHFEVVFLQRKLSPMALVNSRLGPRCVATCS